MSIETPPSHWPFLPDSLENAVESGVLGRLLAGVSSLLGVGVVAVPASVLTGTKERVLLRPGRDPSQGWCRFCRTLRSSGMMGFAYCQQPDLAHIANIWNAFFSRGDRDHHSYKCDFGLTNYLFPLVASGRLVGCLVAGQLLASDSDRSLGIERIAALPLDDPKRAALTATLQEESVTCCDALERLIRVGMDEASFLSEYLTNELHLFRERRESDLVRTAIHTVSEFPRSDMQVFQKNFTSVLTQVRDFCGFDELLGFLSQPESDDNILRFFAGTGTPSESLTRLHYNWRKGGFQTRDRSEVVSSTDTARIARGLKNQPGDFLNKVSAFSAYAMGSGPKALVLAIGPPRRDVSLATHSEFFDRLARSVLHAVVSDLQGIALRKTVELYREQMLTGSHHMMDALSNSLYSLGFLEARLEREKVPEWYWDRLGAIQTDMSNAFGLARRSLSWHRFTDKRYRFSPTHIQDLLQTCVDVKRAFASTRHIEIDVDPGVIDLPVVDMDADMMRMVINCLVDNAVKYAHPETTVTVEGRRTRHKIVVTISDFGLGIAESDKKTIFAFQYTAPIRGKSADQPRQGIGLHFAADVVYSHDGDIWCEQTTGARHSKSRVLEGYLVRFFVELPIQQEPEGANQ